MTIHMLIKKRVRELHLPLKEFATLYGISLSTLTRYIYRKNSPVCKKNIALFQLEKPSVRRVRKRIRDLGLTVEQFCKMHDIPLSVVQAYVSVPRRQRRYVRHNVTHLCYIPVKFWHLFTDPLPPKKEIEENIKDQRANEVLQDAKLAALL